ncbi:hypothetical protein [Rubrivivax gelatinosus]|uniref:hypothetical protein n=1 Tax=Rubrivivax gelatinosus TaxID=28068 RepID=UPI00190540D0|nr:hypothetical protein [Rubrivivax gelatinosus]
MHRTAAAIAATAEGALYLALFLYATSRVTGGLSGVVAIIVISYGWLFLWLRVWATLWVATALLPKEGIEHAFVSCVGGYFTSLALMAAIGASGGWKRWWPLVAGTALSHILGATLLFLWSRKKSVSEATPR